MDFWEKVKKDVSKGVKEGIATIREKAGELTEEGKKRYKIYELKAKAQKEIAELGGKVYDLSKKLKNPMADSKVKTALGKIKKLEGLVAKLEGKKPAAKKPAAKKKAPARK